MSRDFTPENTETTLYINCGSYGTFPMDFSYLIEKAHEHFGEEISLSELDITSEYIHTRCVGYDLYDSSDYDCFIVITRKI